MTTKPQHDQHTPYLEVCCGTPESLYEAAKGGADRAEFCCALELGGLTPPFTAAAERLHNNKEGEPHLPFRVLIRPRPGDFVYDAHDIEEMVFNIHLWKGHCDGFVIGMLTPEGDIDKVGLKPLIEAAGGMNLTFHRAFDQARDPHKALEDIIELGFDRVLTSGCAPTAEKGMGTLAELQRQADGRIIIMAGGGVTPANALRIAGSTGVKELHSSCSTTICSRMSYRNEKVNMGASGVDDYAYKQTSAKTVSETMAAIGRNTINN